MGRDSSDGPPQNGGERLVVRYRALWQTDEAPDVFRFLADHPQAAAGERVEVICHDLERCHEIGAPRRIEEYFERLPDIAEAQKLVFLEHAFRVLGSPDVEEFLDRFPEFSREKLRRKLLESDRSPAPPTNAPDESTLDGPYSSEEWNHAVGMDSPSEDAYRLLDDGSGPYESALSALPERIGKLRVERLLKVTKFKEVYIAHHEGLDLDVVVKRARPGVGLILEEARVLARLDHPGIVKIYDADEEADGRGYLVEQLIDGTDLAEKIVRNRPSHAESANLIASVAGALQHVHTAGVFHRDIKPANILIDRRGRPLVTDFGLALRVEDLGDEKKQGGTVIYMSPEQARGEGHLVDGRTDVYSLGLVFYEMLTGVRTFDGSSVSEVLERIKSVEIRPPRQIDDSIPEELERICLKAASKRAADRYNTARDMADDLRRFLERASSRTRWPVAPGSSEAAGPAPTRGRETRVPVRPSSPRILHKGLRSFDREDADFFPELLPGPRDSEGLPESIRFWKIRIEEEDPDRTFRVGLIYGPSGCGKSSLLRAGLLPRLDDRIVSVLIDATRESTEATLLTRIRRKIPSLDPALDLRGTLAELRQGIGVPPGKKVLLVIDQFEQWLHGDCSVETSELTQALRHCDGEHLQCVLLLRDDFWMAITRFMHELEIPLQEGRNSTSVDLFDLRHARKVLCAFGRAYQRIPPTDEELTKEQRQYLDLALAGLAEDGMIIPVRLAIFAEMVKNRRWLPKAFREVGGALGVGVEFLEETFSAPHSPPEYRRQQFAVRSVLHALLPDPGADLRGHARSRRELLEASGRAHRPRDFEELMRILDVEVRLLTPVDAESVQAKSGETTEPYYQLTHDYLVPPLREWLTRKQRETRRGRAELLLEDRFSLWNAKPERKQLPSWHEFLRMVIFTRSARWSEKQRRFLGAAGRLHATRLVSVLVLVALLFGGRALYRDWRVNRLVTDAHSAWRQGKADWPTTCELLKRAYLLDPTHPALEALLLDISREGSLTVYTGRTDARIEVVEDSSEADRLGLSGIAPAVLTARSTFNSGDRIPLAPGHYRLTLHDGDRSCELLVFVGQTRFEEGVEGWQDAGLVPPEGTVIWNPARQNGASSFVLGEEQVIRSPRLPAEITESFAYIHPGMTWTAESEEFSTAEPLPSESSAYEPLRGIRPKRLVAEYLKNGFLMMKDEVSIEEFEGWWRAFPHAAFNADVESWTQALLSGTSGASLEELKQSWRGLLESRVQVILSDASGSDLEDLKERWSRFVRDGRVDWDRLRTCEEVCQARAMVERSMWLKYERKLGNILSSEENKQLPVTHVNWLVALLYARTHAAIDHSRFRDWLDAEARRSTFLIGNLEDFMQILRAERAPGFAISRVPEDIHVPDSRKNGSDFNGWSQPEERPLLNEYANWLYWKVRFSGQLPGRSMFAWARRSKERLDSSIRDKLPDLEKALLDTASDLRDEDSAGASAAKGLVKLLRDYSQPIEYWEKNRTFLLDRQNLLQWLDGEVSLVRKRREKLGNLLERLAIVAATDARLTQLEIPWSLRVEFGHAVGWNLPTAQQWERAFRGPDSRAYPWGNAEQFLNAWLGPGRSGPRVRGGVHDVSPFGVRSLAGNVSEWILSPTRGGFRYLKGGNFKHGPTYADGGCVIAVKNFDRGSFAGFRVIREIRPGAD